MICTKLYEQFSCIAGRCPASCCCTGWSIIWTKEEVKKLSCRSAEIADKVSSAFYGDGEYKTIRLNEDDSCPFFTEQGLCEIQKNYGAQYLSYTCRQYPRVTRSCGNVILSSCKPTCYAVLEILFSDRDCMELCSTDKFNNVETLISDEADAKQRLDIFHTIRKILWSGDIKKALADVCSTYRLPLSNNIQQRFYKNFGWEIIAADGEHLQAFVQRNLVLALFMQWLTTGYRADKTMSENVGVFVFLAEALIIAANGAAALAESKEEMLCSIADFIAAVTVNKDIKL